MDMPGFLDLPDHLKRLPYAGNPLLEHHLVIDIEASKGFLEPALNYSNGCKGGPPP